MRITGIRFLSYHFSLCFLETNFRNYRNFLVIFIMDKFLRPAGSKRAKLERCVLRQFVSISIVREFVSRSIDFHDISCQYFLERLSLILMCRETKCGNHDVTLVEPARRQVAQHGAHILVFKLRAQFLQHDVALLDAARLLFRTLYAEDLALAYHFQNLCFHRCINKSNNTL